MSELRPGARLPSNTRGGPVPDRYRRRLVPVHLASRGGPEPGRYRRRLVTVHHASCGGPEPARLPPRPGPESHATATGRSPLGHANKGTVTRPQYTGQAQQSHSRHGDRSPTASAARGPCPTDTNQGLVVTFQVTGRAQPQQSVPSQATARPSVASHAGHRIPAGGGRYQRSYLSCRADRAGAHRDRGPLRADFNYSEQPR